MGASVMDILANYNPSGFQAHNKILESQAAAAPALAGAEIEQRRAATQQLQVETQQRQQAIADAQKFMQVYAANTDPASLPREMAQSGMSGIGFSQRLTELYKMGQERALMDKTQLENDATRRGVLADKIQGIDKMAAGPERDQAWQALQSDLQAARVPFGGSPAYDPTAGKAAINYLGHGAQMSAEALKEAEAKEKSTTAALNAAKTPGEVAKSSIETAKATAMQSMTPDKLAAQVGATIDPQKEPGEYRRTLALASNAVSNGLGMEGVQAAIKDGADRIGRRESAIAQARATAPIKIYTAAETEKAKNAQDALSPEALHDLADSYRRTGVMPSMGMRNPVAMRQIINTAAAMGPMDPASASAAFKANQASLTGLVKNRDAVAAFENTAGKNLDLFLKTAQPVIDSGSPWLNTPIRTINEKALGSTELPAFQAARQVAINEIAKVTGNPGLSGQLSDSARKEVEAFIPANATLGQIYSVAKILKQDMANRHESYNEQIADIQKRVSGAPATVTSETPKAAPTAVTVGQTVKLKGKGNVKVTAVHSDGSFDYE